MSEFITVQGRSICLFVLHYFLVSFMGFINFSLLCFQVGQCGNQIGSAFWPLALQEHGITTSKPVAQHQRSRYNDAFHSFFSSPHDVSGASYKSINDLESAKVKARVSIFLYGLFSKLLNGWCDPTRTFSFQAVLIDMEDSVVARFRKGPLRKLFDETLLLTNYPGSGNNWYSEEK